MRCRAWLRRRRRKADHEESRQVYEKVRAQRPEVQGLSASVRAHGARNGFGESMALAFEQGRRR